MQGVKHIFLENGREIFLRKGLDRGDGVEMVEKIGVLARRIPYV